MTREMLFLGAAHAGTGRGVEPARRCSGVGAVCPAAPRPSKLKPACTYGAVVHSLSGQIRADPQWSAAPIRSAARRQRRLRMKIHDNTRDPSDEARIHHPERTDSTLLSGRAEPRSRAHASAADFVGVCSGARPGQPANAEGRHDENQGTDLGDAHDRDQNRQRVLVESARQGSARQRRGTLTGLNTP